jgi:hypothetical protein
MDKLKKTYTAPEVTVHGSVSSLTFGGSSAVADGGGMAAMIQDMGMA